MTGRIELPLVRRSIAIGGREWAVETVDDQEALLQAAEGRDPFPFGLMLWESAAALAEELYARPGLVSGRSVLELGCGIGLSGVVAAALGGRVLATDHDAGALAAAKRTAEINGVSGVETAVGDWLDWRVPGRFEVILGADVAYDADDHAALLGVLDAALAPGGAVLLADPGRTAQAGFLVLARAAGWDVTSEPRTTSDLKAGDGRRLPITLMRLVRRRSRAEARLASPGGPGRRR